jgi:hypothetical protein
MILKNIIKKYKIKNNLGQLKLIYQASNLDYEIKIN